MDSIHRIDIGEMRTVGDLRRAMQPLADNCPLAVRNAPLPKAYYLLVAGAMHFEIEIPDID